MKRFLLLSAIGVLSGISAFGAACASGVTLDTLISNGACEVTNGQGALWTISNWGLESSFAIKPEASDLFVSWAPTPAGLYGGAGFSITFSDTPGGLDWFQVGSNSKINLRPVFWVTSSNLPSTAWTETNTALVSVTNTVLPNLPTAGGPGQVSVQTIVNTQGGAAITDALVLWSVGTSRSARPTPPLARA
jgi:hypothetical protein